MNPIRFFFRSLPALKFLIIPALFLRCGNSEAPAQGFEGTLHFEMITEITDPALRQRQEASLRQAQEAYNSPEMAKSIATIEAQLKDPAFLKQLENNPDLKKMLESQLATLKKMRQGGEGIPGNVADASRMEMVYQFKDGNILTRTGGLALELLDADRITLFRKADNKTYVLDPEAKTYQELGQPAEDFPLKGTVTPAQQDSTILGYRCQKYLINFEVKDQQEPLTGFVWATPDLPWVSFNNLLEKDPSMRELARIKGVALIMEMNMPGSPAKMRMQIREVKRERLPAANFEIPAGFRKA